MSFISSPLFAVMQCSIYFFGNDWLKFDVSLVTYLNPTMVGVNIFLYLSTKNRVSDVKILQ